VIGVGNVMRIPNATHVTTIDGAGMESCLMHMATYHAR
jgi:hypothetical protein